MKSLKILSGLFCFLIVTGSQAQVAEKAITKSAGMSAEELLLLIFGMVASGIAIVAMLVCISILLTFKRAIFGTPITSTVSTFSFSVWLNEKFGTGKLVAVGEEQSIALDHNYDGIVELDNGMPPWLRYVFSGSIIFAVVYLMQYLVLDYGLNPTQEYEQELAIAQEDAEKRKLLATNSIDESNVTLLDNKDLIAEGKMIFEQNCKACHGGAGEGGVGPNLTDAYWIHGGKVNDVFKIIKYGIPEKGMISWQAKLKPLEIQKVSSYIISLQGSNPANGKAPQGELFEAEKSISVLK